MMLGARATGSRAGGLSPRAGDLAVDSPCPHVLSKREHCHHSQPTICALHVLLSSIYKRMVGWASREHLSDGDPLWHTICALHAWLPLAPLLLICVLLPSRLPGLVCLFICVLLDRSAVGGGASSYQHLAGGEPLWCTTCALHVLLALCLCFVRPLLSPRSLDTHHRRR